MPPTAPPTLFSNYPCYRALVRLLSTTLLERWSLLVLCCAFVLPAALPRTAHAQFRQLWAAEALKTGQTANLFATWEGNTPIDGVYVDVPADCRISSALLLRNGYEPVPVNLRPVRGTPNRYLIAGEHALNGTYELVLQADVGTIPGTATWTLTPFAYLPYNRLGGARVETREVFRAEFTTEFQLPSPPASNNALAFEPGHEDPLLLEGRALPDLSKQAPHTIEFWMKTTGLNEVVFSTWDGDEGTPYPIELIVDVGGRLLYYHGFNGTHQSMMTPRPVADGSWHHLAVSNDPTRNWTYLILDGRPADSLYTPLPLSIDRQDQVALGGRLPAHDARRPGLAVDNYSGMLDEVRFWPVAYTAADIRRTMREPADPPPPGQGVVLNFERDLPRQLTGAAPFKGTTRPADLVFYTPVQNFDVDVEGPDILLSWETEDQQTLRFIVERSTDGQHFEEVGSVPAAAEARRFSFRDVELSEDILFYRIRQQFRNGTERLSGTLKMGLGEAEHRTATLIGNFPNPFNPTTTITYELRETQHVRVSVMDLAGQMVAMLVDEVRPAGYYEVQFDAGDLPSGPYFIRLQTREGVQSHKIILTK